MEILSVGKQKKRRQSEMLRKLRKEENSGEENVRVENKKLEFTNLECGDGDESVDVVYAVR